MLVSDAVDEAEIKAALKTWRDGLVGLTRQSALIKFRAPKRSSLQIDSPDLDEVLARLQSGKPQGFRGDVDDDGLLDERPQPMGMVFHCPRPDNEVGPIARTLMRKASAEFLDRGLAVLYMAFGILDWQDVDETAMVSPLLLVPVQLLPEGPKGTPRVTVGEDDPVLNPALALRLKEFGIELPTTQDIEGQTVTETLAAVKGTLEKNKTFAGWRLREVAYLATFSFAKEAMFKDLLDNEEAILEHPIVRALATSDPSAQSPEFQFDPIDPTDIDKVAPPEVTPLVLDADSSQRSAIAASLAGKTFVMDGPPGTGKSQTIANMIGALLHCGKTVLFVSEKIAALDVVRNRLDAAGLGSYLLELHSHKSSRKEVATELLRTLDNVARPPGSMSALSRHGVRERREQLNAYAAAMNDIRKPLNMSLHKVLGMSAQITHAAVAPVPEIAPTSLSDEDYLGVQETLSKLVRAWRPAVQGQSFLWRDVIDDRSLEVRLYQAESALEELHGTVRLNARVIDAFDLAKPSDTPQLIALVEHHQRAHARGVTEQWLTAESLDTVVATRLRLSHEIEQLKAAEDAATSACGVPWTAMPVPSTLPISPSPVAAAPSPIDLNALRASELSATADRFEGEARTLRERVDSLSSLATSLGLPPVETFADINRVIRLVNLRSQDSRPDRRWFTTAGLADARAKAAELRDHGAALAAAEAKASTVFTTTALQAPLADLQDRFTNLHRGLKKLSGNYRTDKRAIAGLLTEAADVKTGIAHLSDAITWGQANQAYESFASAYGETFGSYWAGRDTNYKLLNSAFDVVDEVLTLVGGPTPANLVTYLTSSDSNDAYQSIVDAAKSDIESWKASLQPAPALSGRPELLVGSIKNAAEWLLAHVEPARQAIDRIGPMNAATGKDLSLVAANELADLTAALVMQATFWPRARQPIVGSLGTSSTTSTQTSRPLMMRSTGLLICARSSRDR